MRQKKKLFTTKKIAILSLSVALTVIFCFVPISFGAVTLALMILPTLIVALTDDLPTTAVLGLFMGLINYLAWFTTKAGSPLAPVFQNPLVCILPRLLIGICAWAVRFGLGKLLLRAKYKETDGKEVLLNKKYLISMETLIAVVSTAVGVTVNTLFVGLFTLLFYNGETLGNNLYIDVEYILAWFGLNFAIEVASFSVIAPAIALALRQAKLVPPEKTVRVLVK